ncbi:hypothetical protein KP509_15G058700 [Ceratopteris richardii]|uniref:Uncharacterized protein n=1 Tax=Ceratopteris richardii TaxID=49495 RepID=A0A8T2TA08_CERRI|nr:hypothetical protein KP509_15G058700 [Ceratopteris richardii]
MGSPFMQSIDPNLLLAMNSFSMALTLITLAEFTTIRGSHHHCSVRLEWLLLSIFIVMFWLSFVGCCAPMGPSSRLSWLYIFLLLSAIILHIALVIYAFRFKIHGFSTSAHVPSAFLGSNNCKQELLSKFKKDWGTIAVTSLVSLGILSGVLVLGCYGLYRNSSTW